MPVVSQNIEELEGSVERAQEVLDQVRRALDAAESAEQHADAAAMLRRAAGVIAVGAAVAVVVILLGGSEPEHRTRPMTEQGIAERASSRTVSASVPRRPMG